MTGSANIYVRSTACFISESVMILLHGSIAQSTYCAIAALAPSSSQRRRNKDHTVTANRKTTKMMTDYTPAVASRSAWASPIAALGDAWVRYRLYRRTYAELNALTSRDLDDLGISRSMITRLAYEAAYGRNA
jgi:uncharacterized protein YjiS (DUF1127 family)